MAAQKENTNEMDALPNEMLAMVLSMVPCLVRIGTCQLVCTRWHRVALDDVAIGRKPCTRRRLDCRPRITPSVVRSYHHAARWGHVDCLRHAYEKGDRWDASLCLLAAYNGHAKALAWLLGQGRARDLYDESGPTAIEHGYDRYGVPKSLAVAAIHGKSIDCVECVLSHGIPLPQDACVEAALVGDVDMLRHLHAKGCALNERVCRAAATRRKLDCLKYARESGLSLAICNLKAAIQHGDDAVVGYAIQSGWEPAQEDLYEAIYFGRAQCVVHMLDAGLSLNDANWNVAVDKGHVPVIECALDRGWTPTPTNLVTALCADRCEIVHSLTRRQGCPFEGINACLAIVESRSVSAMRRLGQYGYPWDERLCEAAVATDNCDMLRYLYENGCPWDWQRCMAKAQNKHHSCYRYLRRNRVCDSAHYAHN